MGLRVISCKKCKMTHPIEDMENVGRTVYIVLKRLDWRDNYLICKNCLKKLKVRVLDFLEED